MSLRSMAESVYQASQSDRVSEARKALGDVLTPYDVSALTVEHFDFDGTSTRVVFTDGDIHLGVRDKGGWNIALVDPATFNALVKVESLAHLGKLLPTYDSRDENAVPAWAPGQVLEVGKRRSYKNFIWKVIKAHTTQTGQEPDVAPTLWTKVAA